MKSRVFNLFILFALLLSFVGSFTSVTPAYAAGIVVNTAADEDNTGTDCSLREAITAANTDSAYGGCPAGAGDDVVTFAGNYTITLGSQLPTVSTTITITGNGVANTIIQASACNPVTLPSSCTPATYRVFLVNAGDLTLDQVTVRHGRCEGLCETAGGIGGGIYKASGTLTINNSLFTANISEDGGGAIYGGFGSVSINKSTFSDNKSLNAGGAITNQGTMTIVNSTVTNNISSSITNYAGGIRNIGTLNIYNSTIAGNAVQNPISTGVNIVQDSGQLNLYNTIIANAINGGDCAIIAGTLNISNSLIESTNLFACNNLANGLNGNIIGSDPNLGSLTGSPAYFPLNTGSPAIDAGDNAICAAAPVNNESQNGAPRPDGTNCDIGSFEPDTVEPAISSITRASTSPTSAASVDFTVTFSEAVQNVDVNDFIINKSGGIAGESVSAISGSGASYVVTVNTGSGNGTIRLDVPIGASVTDLNSNPLSSLPFETGEVYTVNKTPIRLILPSNGTQDGWVRESSETSEVGGTIDASASVLIVGDDASDRQYRSVLSFDTSSLPDAAVISQATLAIRVNEIIGSGNPLKMFNYFMIDVANGSFGTSALAAQDFQASPTVSAGPLGQTNTGGGWLYIDLKTAKSGINLTGLTQLRLRYSLGDNDNGIENILKFYSGNYATVKHRPQLNVWYFLP